MSDRSVLNGGASWVSFDAKICMISPVKGGYAYNWRVALASAPTVYVQTAQTTGGRTKFAGLTPGHVYNIEANVVGAAGVSDWSDAGSLMVI